MTVRPESPYEAAARVADQVEHGQHYLGHHTAAKAAQEIAREIRALPHPPGVTPKFLRDLYYLNVLSPSAIVQLATDINKHLRAQPVSTPPSRLDVPKFDSSTTASAPRPALRCR